MSIVFSKKGEKREKAGTRARIIINRKGRGDQAAPQSFRGAKKVSRHPKVFAAPISESFDQTFSKVCAGGGRGGLLAARRRRNTPNRRVSFCELFLLRLYGQKKKRLWTSHAQNVRSLFQGNPPLVRFPSAAPSWRHSPLCGAFER